MASASVPGMHGWGNQHYPSLLGVLGLSPRHGGGLRAPFVLHILKGDVSRAIVVVRDYDDHRRPL